MEGHADVLARYEFTGDSDSSTDDDVTNTYSIADDLAPSAGLPNSMFLATGSPSPSRTMDVSDTDGTTANAAAIAEDYLEFTIRPEDGFDMDFSHLTVDFDASFTNGLRGYAIRTSLNDYAATTFSYTETSGTGTIGTFITQTFSLSDALYQDITGPVTFRIYGFDSVSLEGSNLRFDNVVLYGTAPEPGRALLLAFSTLGLLARRRR